jgi:ABC-type branched-subunit amino acid transport system permease subunit
MNKFNKLIAATYFVLLSLALLAPMLGLYPVFVMKLLCFAIFAIAFNLLLGFTVFMLLASIIFSTVYHFGAFWMPDWLIPV